MTDTPAMYPAWVFALYALVSGCVFVAALASAGFAVARRWAATRLFGRISFLGGIAIIVVAVLMVIVPSILGFDLGEMKSAVAVSWLVFGAWVLLFGLPGLTAGLLAASVTKLVAAFGAGLLLSIAVAAVWDRCLVQARTFGGIVVTGAATASFCLLVGATADVERRNAEILHYRGPHGVAARSVRPHR